MNTTIQVMFKKLLGNGRAFLFPKGFTSDFYDVFINPFVELKERILATKYTHFPTKNLNINDIVNGEELFGLKNTESLNLKDRASNVEGQWSIFAGTQNYKQIETVLQKKGLPVKVIENIPNGVYPFQYGYAIGNGQINQPDGKSDPIVITDGVHTFFVVAEDFLSEEQVEMMIETLVQNKPAQNGVYYLPRYLRKKEIHHVLTKSQMQTYLKSQYCKVGKGG